MENIKEKILERFEIWWQEEGKFLTPGSSNWEQTKLLIKTSWLNGAYVALELAKADS